MASVHLCSLDHVITQTQVATISDVEVVRQMAHLLETCAVTNDDGGSMTDKYNGDYLYHGTDTGTLRSRDPASGQ